MSQINFRMLAHYQREMEGILLNCGFDVYSTSLCKGESDIHLKMRDYLYFRGAYIGYLEEGRYPIAIRKFNPITLEITTFDGSHIINIYQLPPLPNETLGTTYVGES